MVRKGEILGHENKIAKQMTGFPFLTLSFSFLLLPRNPAPWCFTLHLKKPSKSSIQ